MTPLYTAPPASFKIIASAFILPNKVTRGAKIDTAVFISQNLTTFTKRFLKELTHR